MQEILHNIIHATTGRIMFVLDNEVKLKCWFLFMLFIFIMLVFR